MMCRDESASATSVLSPLGLFLLADIWAPVSHPSLMLGTAQRVLLRALIAMEADHLSLMLGPA